MNWTIEYIENKQFIKVVCEGDFNTSDHLRMIKDITSREFWEPGMRVLFDNRNVDFNKADYNVVSEAARNAIKNNELIGNSRTAILMKSVADFGVGRQFQLLANDNISADLHIFRDEEKALDWLLEKPKTSTNH